MYVRLKQRVLYYLVLMLLFILFGKLLKVHNDCTDGQKVLQKHDGFDPWNLNEHQIEMEVNKAIKEIRRTSNGNLKPIGVPDLDHMGLDKDTFQSMHNTHSSHQDWGPHQLGLIVPYRNRFEEMKEFVPHMNKYLNEKKISHKIYIINQVDSHRFNRASLINVGFKVARNESCDYITMHDVDLLPLNKELNYNYPDLGPFHVSAPHLHPKYHYKTFVGGILSVSVEQFEDVNGLSNKFWGWGREDDEFYMRIVDKGYKIYRHGNEINTDHETFKHEHGKERKRDHVKLPGQREVMFKRDLFTGLHNVKYKIKKRQELFIDGNHCSVIDVEIDCDVTFTPWCDLPRKKSSH